MVLGKYKNDQSFKNSYADFEECGDLPLPNGKRTYSTSQ